MTADRKEISKGIYARVEVCPRCREEWVDIKEHEKVYKEFYSKAFKSGNSLALRIPKKLAEIINLKEGSEVRFEARDNKIIIENIS